MKNIHTFTQASDQYAKHRPQYPDELFVYLSGLVESHESAWDCATGNGQAAVSLARYFSRVEATDISQEQIKNGIAQPNIRYSVSPAEHTSFAAESFDLIVVATAVHWFDQSSFFEEVNRVLKPGGVLAVWSYAYFHIEPEVDEIIRDEFLDPIDPFWADGNRQVMNGYRELSLPFEQIHTPNFSMRVEWTLLQLSGYLRTWSAVKRHVSELGTDPVEKLKTKLDSIWSEPDTIKIIHMPLHLKACRKPVS